MRSIMSIVFCTVALLSFSNAHAAKTWYTANCSAGTLKHQGTGKKFTCEKKQSKPAKCASGWTLNKDSVGKDKCEKVITTVSATKCKLKAGDQRSKWKVKVKSGNDQCEHITKNNKGIRALKCDSGKGSVVKNQAGNRDMCVKSGQKKKKTITCDNGWDHKKAGDDKCVKTTYSRPRF